MPDTRTQIVAFAQQQLGKPYVWGATGPNGYDCSGLVYAAYKAAGLNPQHVTAATLGKTGTAVDQAHAQPGDVVYYDEPGATDHVGLYIGQGLMIDAPTQGKNVEVAPIGHPTSIRDLADTSSTSWIPTWLVNGLTGGLVSPTTGAAQLATGDTQGAAEAAAKLNPFSGWQSDATTIGLKIAGAVTCAALLVIGLKETVK